MTKYNATGLKEGGGIEMSTTRSLRFCIYLPVLIVCLSYTLETSVESNCTRLNSRTIKLSEAEDDNPDLEDLLFEDPLLEESLLLLPPPLINVNSEKNVFYNRCISFIIE